MVNKTTIKPLKNKPSKNRLKWWYNGRSLVEPLIPGIDFMTVNGKRLQVIRQ